MNTWCGIGRITKDVEVRYTTSQMAVTSFTVAIDRHDKEKNCDFVSCVAFGKTAENMEKYLSKGDKIAVVGRIQTGSYKNKDGKTVYTTDIIANNVEFIETKGNSQKTEPKSDADGFMQMSDTMKEELPFL
jgi:single-strand DNA-binding protein